MHESILTFKSQRLHIKDGNLDIPLRKVLDDIASDAIASTRHDHDLLVPIILVARPVVLHAVAEEVGQTLKNAPGEEELQVLERGAVFESERLALLRVSREEHEREDVERVQGGAVEEAAEGVDGDAFAVELPGRAQRHLLRAWGRMQ